jgi:hypothetical protein
MTMIMVRYTVHENRVAENEKLVRAVYEELHERRPAGFQYRTFRVDGGATFVHLASTDGDGPSPLPGIEAFQRFQEGIADRCTEGPKAADLTVVGAYP